MKNPNELSKKLLYQARWRAVIMGGFLIIALISIVFGIVQREEVKRQEASVVKLQEEMLKLRLELIQAQKIVEGIHKNLEAALQDASFQKQRAEENYQKARKIK